MPEPTGFLDLEGFLAGMHVLPKLSEADVFDLFARLVVEPADVAPYIHFRSDTYARNMVYRDDRFEVLCMCWDAGHQTTIHDHGESFGAAFVVAGVFTEERYDRLAEVPVRGNAEPGPELSLRDVVHHRRGDRLFASVGEVHRLSNRQEQGDRTITLHCYAPPLGRLKVFDIRNGAQAALTFPGR